MIDATTKFYNLKETIPREEGTQPIPPIPNVKTIVASYLKDKFDSLNLKNPIPVFTDFPPLVNLFQEITKDGRNELKIKRFVSLVRLSSSVAYGAVGQVINSSSLLDEAGLEATQYGWVEKAQIEVSYWSISPLDRDRGGDYTKLLMLEMHRNGYLLRNGILSFNFRTAYDNADERILENQMVYMYVMQFDLMHFFAGTEVLDTSGYPLIDDIEIRPVPVGADSSVDAILGAMGLEPPQDNVQYSAAQTSPTSDSQEIYSESTSGPEGDKTC